MKIENCSFSGLKIYPGKGQLFVSRDSKVYRFFNHKAASLHRQRKNARKLDWTVLARRMNKKGVTATVQRKKNRRVIKATRGFNGASVDDINKIATQKSAVREAARRSAIQKAKDTKKQSEATKKAAAAKAGAPKTAANKNKATQKMGAKPMTASSGRMAGGR